MNKACAWMLLLPLGLSLPCQPAGAQSGDGTLRWSGCSMSRNAYLADLAKAFTTRTGVEILVDGGGATRGIRDVARLNADIGGSCRFVIEGDERESAAVLKPVAWDALVAIVHPNNPVSDIGFAQLRDIFLGRIDNWQALGGPDRPLELYVRRGRTTGVGRVTRRLLFADFSMEFRASKYFEASPLLEKAVENSPWSIAITGASSARRRDVKILSLDGNSASYDNVRSGRYALFLPLYLVTSAGSRNQPLVDQFVQFAYSPDGMAVMRRNGVVPYNDALHLVMKEHEQSERARSPKR